MSARVGLTKGDKDDAKRAVVGRCEPRANYLQASRARRESHYEMCENRTEDHDMGDVDLRPFLTARRTKLGS